MADKSQSPSSQQSGEAGGEYSEIAKTVANIRRLQENVMSVSIRSGPHQVPVQAEHNNIRSGNHQGGPSASNQEHQNNVVVSVSSSSPQQQQLVTAEKQLSSPVSSCQQPAIKDESQFNAMVTAMDPQWQSTKLSVRDRNAVMFNNTLLADVWFSVGSEQLQAQLGQPPGQLPTDQHQNTAQSMPKKIPAHKYVLATSSTVFYAMFYGGVAGDRDKDLIEVPDVEPQVRAKNIVMYRSCMQYSQWRLLIFDFDFRQEWR